MPHSCQSGFLSVLRELYVLKNIVHLSGESTLTSRKPVRCIWLNMLTNPKPRHSIEGMLHERNGEDNGSRKSLLAEIIDRSMHRVFRVFL